MWRLRQLKWLHIRIFGLLGRKLHKSGLGRGSLLKLLLFFLDIVSLRHLSIRVSKLLLLILFVGKAHFWGHLLLLLYTDLRIILLLIEHLLFWLGHRSERELLG